MPAFVTRRTALALTATAVCLPLAAPRLARAAAIHEVQMLNVHPEDRKLRQIFLPRLLVVRPGDTVAFVPTDRGHNSAILDGMVPEGGTNWDGKIGEEVSVTLELPGFYGYQCTPHYSTGMVGLIVVEGEGMTANLADAQDVRHRGKARQVFDEIWAEVAVMGLSA